MQRVLIGSPVRQRPRFLAEFLDSLQAQQCPDASLSFFFIDDNDSPTSRQLLRDFSGQNARVLIETRRDDMASEPLAYERTEYTHNWNEALIWKVAAFKNDIIAHALQIDADYLFLFDSDLVLHPRTLAQLLNTQKDIVSEIFWTKWQADTPSLPQVWVSDDYVLYERARGECLSQEQKDERQNAFLEKLRQPGLYPVGGLGACTLISKRAMQAGVHFGALPNFSFWGEDRHFCLRAVALGFELFVDTHCPAHHLYRESDLAGIAAYKASFKPEQLKTTPLRAPKPSKKPGSRLTLSMTIHNESGAMLRRVLESHRAYIDEAVIIDNASTDDSAAICREVLDGIPLFLVRNEKSRFDNEVELRQQQWREATATCPDWILNLDADQLWEERFASVVRELTEQDEIDVFCFRLFDFWDEEHFREDEHWNAHLSYRPFLMRYRPDFQAQWKDAPIHCGHFPTNVWSLPAARSELRLKHFGWATPQLRESKYRRYQQLDPEGRYGDRAQYESILDANPRLIRWQE